MNIFTFINAEMFGFVVIFLFREIAGSWGFPLS
jgi:hypothetical protein